MRRTLIAQGLLLAFAALALPRPATAGCGCEKPPPRVAAVRPAVTYAGMTVTLFSNAFQVGQPYTVSFTSGTSTGSASVTGTAVSRRDLANGMYKPQVRVPLPASLPLGPTRISVTGATAGGVVLSIPDTDFTVAPQPIALPTAYGSYQWPNFRGAVGRNGVVYVSIDLTGMTQPLVFEADLQGYPLRFTNQDVIFRNAQGFLMQTLVWWSPTGTAPVPGMFVQPAASPSTTSDQLHYSRHEFNTYFLQHMERLPHALDPVDGNWHVDGTPHIDHDHLILAISARRNDGTLPVPGATPACTLRMSAYSLFYQGLVGTASVKVTSSVIDSYDHVTGVPGSKGDVFTNGLLSLQSATVKGNATAGTFSLTGSSAITGVRTTQTAPMSFMAVKVPTGLPDLGSIKLYPYQVRSLVGPGSFLVKDISLPLGSRLFVDNSQGPVTLYVTGTVSMSGGAQIATADHDPETFAMYLPNATSSVLLSGGSNPTSFYGTVYAPNSKVTLNGNAHLHGAFVGGEIDLRYPAHLHYDSRLRGN